MHSPKKVSASTNSLFLILKIKEKLYKMVTGILKISTRK